MTAYIAHSHPAVGAVACPTCFVMPGSICRMTRLRAGHHAGDPAKGTHKRRVLAWERDRATTLRTEAGKPEPTP